VSDLLAMLEGCRADPKNRLRHLIFADFVDDYIDDSDWSELIRTSVEYPPVGARVPEEVQPSFHRLAKRLGLWPSPWMTGGYLFMWDGDPHRSLSADIVCRWWYGVAQVMWLPARPHPLEQMQPGCSESG